MRPLHLLRRSVLGAISGGLLMAAMLPADALKPVFTPPLVALSVIDRDTGESLTVYRKDGVAYVAGRPGARYALRLQSQAGGRVLAVVSVDGINVIGGQTAAWNQTGYVLRAGQHYDVTGWRKSDDEVAAFEFAALGESYAARTGRPEHVGVLGVAVFMEKAEPPPVAVAPPEVRIAPAPMAAPAPAARSALRSVPDVIRAESATVPAERLGTAHGERETDHIRNVEFERMTPQPQLVLRIEYDSRENLVAAGVIPTPSRYGRADPFPANAPQRYVPDPPAR